MDLKEAQQCIMYKKVEAEQQIQQILQNLCEDLDGNGITINDIGFQETWDMKGKQRILDLEIKLIM